MFLRKVSFELGGGLGSEDFSLLKKATELFLTIFDGMNTRKIILRSENWGTCRYLIID